MINKIVSTLLFRIKMENS